MSDKGLSSSFCGFNQGVLHAFELHADLNGEAIAVKFETETLTYGELNLKANGLAVYFSSLGLDSQSSIGIYLEPGLLTAVAILGVLKAGCTYVPVSSSDPVDRIAFVLNDTSAGLLLGSKSLLSRISNISIKTLALDTIWEKLDDFAAYYQAVTYSADKTAYILYTSGSSGKPKGVMVTHGNLHYYLLWHCKHLRVEIEHADLPLSSSICFAAAVTQFYTPLLLGRILHIFPQGLLREPERVFAWYDQHPEYALYCVPTVWNELLNYAQRQRKLGIDLVCPKRLLLSGEAISESLVNKSTDLWPQLGIWNLYGPTEATANASAGEVKRGKPVNLGKELAGTRIYLFNENMQEVSGNETGEIYISGDGVASGYLNLPELTEQRFISHSFSGDDSKRMFKTGDLARYNQEGELIYVGRADFQVKIRGFRIECGEIEAVLSSHPAILQTAVVFRIKNANDYEKTLIAYISFRFAHHISITELREFLAKQLPDYMIPGFFVVMEALPQLANGKLDRNLLPLPGNERPNLGYLLVAPKNVREQRLIRVWEEVLSLEGLGTEDNFFDLGGDSLKVASAIAIIEDRFQIKVSYRDFFNNSTPSKLSILLGSLVKNTETQNIIKPLPTQSLYPCADSQRSLWFLMQTFPNLNTYNIQFSLHFTGTLNRHAVANSLAAIVKRHESLRSVFIEQTGRPYIQIAAYSDPEINFVDLTDINEILQVDEMNRLATEQSTRPFVLNKEPLYRFSLYRLSPEQHYLYVTVHHIIFDGRSIEIFSREFVDNYHAFEAGFESLYSPLTIQYQDWVAWHQEAHVDDKSSSSLQYWRQQLQDRCQLLNFPSDYVRPGIRTFNGSCEKLRIDNKFKTRLLAFNRSENTTSFMTLFAVFNALLYRYSGQEEILIGCPVANRHPANSDKLIGFFVNTLVLVTQFKKEDSFRELLARTRQTSLESFDHSSITFEKVLDILRPQRNLNTTPLFQMMFAYHTAMFRKTQNSQLQVDVYEEGNPGSKYDMTLDAYDDADGLELRLSYNTDLYSQQTAKRFLEHYVRLLESILIDPSRQINQYPLTSSSDIIQFKQWNNTAIKHSEIIGLHHLFSKQASLEPGRVALTVGNESLSYSELERLSNQLARHLVTYGVTKGSVVGVHLKADANMIISLLAILKTGAAYVPLDPYYPLERLNYIIEDSGMSVIVSEDSFLERLTEFPVTIISVDSDWHIISTLSSEVLVVEQTNPDDLMYLMYTSGSTGKPKGVMVPHRGPTNYVLWMMRVFLLSTEDKVLLKTSINFDISVWELFLPLISGAELVVGRREDLQAPELLARLISQQQITTIQFVPSALRAFVDSGCLSSCSSLKRIFSGGEVLPANLHNEVLEVFAGELHNLYGPTEASIYVGHWHCQRATPIRCIPIGHPIDNTSIHILDERMQEVPIGMMGEIYIGGVNVALGYLNKPELTAAAFVSDPYRKDESSKLFKTNDLARYLPDGNIEFLGRCDRQVKVRGYRIELDEVEHHVSHHPQVKHAIIIVREDKANDIRLVAYMLYRDNDAPSPRELRDYLKKKLPDYMIPSTFITLDSIPMLPNNKVNFGALPKPEFEKTLNADWQRNYDNTNERVLAKIWEEVLENDRFNLDDNFFDVGGHSLLISQLGILIEKQMNIKVSNIDLFQFPTVRSLAKHLAHCNDNSFNNRVSDIARRAALNNQRKKPTSKGL